MNGKPVFPFFDAQDLERIACDTFRREPEDALPPAPAEKRVVRLGPENARALQAWLRAFGQGAGLLRPE
jgi:hypothetical protein